MYPDPVEDKDELPPFQEVKVEEDNSRIA